MPNEELVIDVLLDQTLIQDTLRRIEEHRRRAEELAQAFDDNLKNGCCIPFYRKAYLDHLQQANHCQNVKLPRVVAFYLRTL